MAFHSILASIYTDVPNNFVPILSFLESVELPVSHSPILPLLLFTLLNYFTNDTNYQNCMHTRLKGGLNSST